MSSRRSHKRSTISESDRPPDPFRRGARAAMGVYRLLVGGAWAAGADRWGRLRAVLAARVAAGG